MDGDVQRSRDRGRYGRLRAGATPGSVTGAVISSVTGSWNQYSVTVGNGSGNGPWV